MKWGCIGHWGHRGCWGCRGHWGCRDSKAWKITIEDVKVIQVAEFSFILMFWKNLFWGRIMKYKDEFFAPFLSEAVEASIFYFLKNWRMKLKCPILLKPLDTIIQENYQPFYPSEPFRITRFKMRHPVFRISFGGNYILKKYNSEPFCFITFLTIWSWKSNSTILYSFRIRVLLKGK